MGLGGEIEQGWHFELVRAHASIHGTPQCFWTRRRYVQGRHARTRTSCPPPKWLVSIIPSLPPCHSWPCPMRRRIRVPHRGKPVNSTLAIGGFQRLLDSRAIRASTRCRQYSLDPAALTRWNLPAPPSLIPSTNSRSRRSAPPSLRHTCTLAPRPRDPPFDFHPGAPASPCGSTRAQLAPPSPRAHRHVRRLQTTGRSPGRRLVRGTLASRRAVHLHSNAQTSASSHGCRARCAAKTPAHAQQCRSTRTHSTP